MWARFPSTRVKVHYKTASDVPRHSLAVSNAPFCFICSTQTQVRVVPSVATAEQKQHSKTAGVCLQHANCQDKNTAGLAGLCLKPHSDEVRGLISLCAYRTSGQKACKTAQNAMRKPFQVFLTWVSASLVQISQPDPDLLRTFSP